MKPFLRIGIVVALLMVALSAFWRKSPPAAPEQSAGATTPAPVDHGDAEWLQMEIPALQFRQPPGLGLVLAEELAKAPLRITPQDLASLVLLAENRITREDNASRLAVDAVLESIDPGSLLEQQPERIKEIAIDAFLQGLGPGDLPARYNAASHTLAAVQRAGSWQCSTGTLLFNLAALRLPADRFRAHHFVLIYERGHVLPGYLRRVRDAWRLYGLEMTVIGAGRKDYGPTADLARRGFALRIVRAPEALLVQAVGPFITNGNEVATDVLRHTAARYDIPLAELERNIRDSSALQSNPTEPSAENPTPVMRAPWSFGRVDVPPGDRTMMRLERLDPRNHSLSFSELLRALPPEANNDDPFNPVTEPNNATEAPPGAPQGGRIVYPWEAEYPAGN